MTALPMKSRIDWLRPLALMAILLPAGCSNSGESEVNLPSDTSGTETIGKETIEPGSRGTIGFSALTLKNPFFKVIADTMTVEGEKQGFKVVVTDADRDTAEQTRQIETFVTQGVTAIVLNPTDRVAVGPAIRTANAAGIPVFTCDLQCVDEAAKIAGHIGTDNYAGGVLAGEAMCEALSNTGGDVLVVHFKQANSCVLRVQGFTEAINKHNAQAANAKINIVGEVEGGGLKDEGHVATSAALQTHQNLSGIFAINDPSAIGAWKAVDEAGRTDQITIVGFDGMIEGKLAILEGRLLADPIQFPDQMAIATVDNIVKYLDGDSFEAVTLIPTQLYYKADAERDPEVKAALAGSTSAPADDPTATNQAYGR